MDICGVFKDNFFFKRNSCGPMSRCNYVTSRIKSNKLIYYAYFWLDTKMNLKIERLIMRGQFVLLDTKTNPSLRCTIFRQESTHTKTTLLHPIKMYGCTEFFKYIQKTLR